VQSSHERLDQLLQKLLQISNTPDTGPSRPNIGEVGDEEIQEAEETPAESMSMAEAHTVESAGTVYSLAISSCRCWTIGAG